MTLDELRAAHPELGLAVYAYEPGGDVTLDIHDGSGVVYTFGGATLQEAIEKAFPPVVSQTPFSVGSAPALRPTHDSEALCHEEVGGVAETTGEDDLAIPAFLRRKTKPKPPPPTSAFD